jgi:hypothetical protein
MEQPKTSVNIVMKAVLHVLGISVTVLNVTS